MKLFGLWTMLVALTISGVAAYYSIIGLVAIFAAAMIPIIIMGAALEVGKLTTAVWLHANWNKAKWWMKLYLSFALVALMFITSMGIFGFLSKAHIEQTAANAENVAQIERIDAELARNEGLIARSEQKIQKAESSVGNNNANIQEQIDTEQKRIDDTLKRIQPAIDEQNKIIADARKGDETKVAPYMEQLKGLDAELARLDKTANDYETKLAEVGKDTTAINEKIAVYQKQIDQINADIEELQRLSKSGSKEDIKKFQQTIGIRSDGFFGQDTAKKTTEWKEANQKRIDELSATMTNLRKEWEASNTTERDRLRGLIADARGEKTQAVKKRKIEVLKVIDEVRAKESPVVASAMAQIAQIRKSADDQIKASQKLINELRNTITVGGDADVDALVDAEQAKIKTATAEIDTLIEEKYKLQASNRKLEAEVGPVKYIAEFIYGDQADKNMLEEAVRWVILILVAVFDPLAVVLVIAGLTLLEANRRPPKIPPDDPGKKEHPEVEPKEEEHQEPELEFMRRAHQDDYIGTPHIEKKRADVTTEEESADKLDAQDGTGSTDREDTEDQGRIPLEETTDTQDDEKEVILNEEENTREVAESKPEDVETLRDGQEQERIQGPSEDDTTLVEEPIDYNKHDPIIIDFPERFKIEEQDPLDVYNNDRLSTPQDIVDPVEEVIVDEEGLKILRDNQGYYKVVNGRRVSLIDPDQERLNNQYKREQQAKNTRDQIDQTIQKMKDEGRWPNSPEYDSDKDVIRDLLAQDVNGELEDLLEQADESTLKVVYDEILKDLKGN